MLAIAKVQQSAASCDMPILLPLVKISLSCRFMALAFNMSDSSTCQFQFVQSLGADCCNWVEILQPVCESALVGLRLVIVKQTDVAKVLLNSGRILINDDDI
jgi:hypothetical protein